MTTTVRRTLRILDFDIENRPLTYLGGDFTTAEITAIACSLGSRYQVKCWLLGRDEPKAMLEAFRHEYEKADVVTGHYIRRHDLPIINGALMEYGLPLLTPKLTSDTKLDCLKAKDLSRSQESLAAMLGVKAPKVHVTQPEWRAANRLEPDSLAITEARVIGDVRQHQQLREAMIRQGMLGPPKMWRP